MAAHRLYDPPSVQLRRLLLEAREEGLSFAEAWVRAVRPVQSLVMSNTKVVPMGAIRWPTDRTDRVAWRAAIIGAREGWRRAYEGEPPSRAERALEVLADAIGGLEALDAAARERAAVEGIVRSPGVLSAA